jgi:hypothetical protein
MTGIVAVAVGVASVVLVGVLVNSVPVMRVTVCVWFRAYGMFYAREGVLHLSRCLECDSHAALHIGRQTAAGTLLPDNQWQVDLNRIQETEMRR